MPRIGPKSSDHIRSRSNSNSKSITNMKPTKSLNTNTSVLPQNTSLLGTVAQGFAWSTGSTIARNMFDSSKENLANNKSNENNCYQYKLCEKLNDKEECFSKMDVIEYNVCKKLFE